MRSPLTQNRYTDRCLILALRSHPQLQLKVQSGFWLVLPEKSNSGFPVVNPAYEAAITSIIYLLKGLRYAIAITVSRNF
ncbi:hypothetical protein [Planktothrix paucivesiculata]|uniref:Uncharacterized protein n=1 Tax=Planktothrix paucivesiculata PCC 9631 TaxID=671071 RepID=A0A7Z9BZH4_9CYAN|nr:hypothetical protein [Planktothrix paucivesiculata]VXD24128.1 hypothetical protein PL9631_780023 [Planktothrix paucivesiculata PCC 9631]